MIYSKTNFWIVVCLVLFLCGTYAFSQEPTAPSNVVAKDTPNDDGTSITVTWDAAPEDSGILGYVILRNTDEGEFEVIKAELNPDLSKYKDAEIEKGKAHAYIVRAVYDNETPVDSEQTAAVKATGQWFHTGKTPLFLAMLLFSSAIVWNLYHARSGKEVFIRRIPGLEAVEEAIGRATEMGRSILYVLGLGGVDNVATIASMTILGQVARRTADYETALRVPCNDPIVLNVVREMVKTSYLDVGRPDAYNEDDIFFLTNDQFAYAAGVDGMMIREKPAAVFLQGQFYAESLLMAETGNSIGAIQIAGTDSEHQLPFFIAACDYTLIGEELYAASAYLSREPMLLGSLKGQDWGKLLIFAAIILGVSLEFFGINWITTLLQTVS
ncbi:fibronectin type III domain-containing protein [Candidatus Poribacteria bacterium]|nr:fibronectin type III domain-containing protein [Candidatus Poribacteria bacterium]MYB65190.1 fibronectin type III domain-containing protein [Candidatus Poribacteria bacterium]MYF56781.1 fibronectin type III domain-containing protein [Candidatus Poribacteria bacterium]